jgi:PHD/YefM family antitoxin component YafN of YafNO toxin-antitoxin module
VGARALSTNGAVEITSAAPDAARTLAGSGLSDRSDDSPTCVPNHAAEAVVLAAEAWKARMQAVPLPHVA